MEQKAYIIAKNVNDALQAAAGLKDKYSYFAGGTDIQIYRKQGLLCRNAIIDLREIAELKSVTYENDHLIIGAMTTLDELLTAKQVIDYYPLIKEAALSVATPVIRKTATLGGNLLVNNRCYFYNQSEDWRLALGSCLRDKGNVCRVTGGGNKCFSRNVSDLAAALITLDAIVYIQNIEKSFSIPLRELYKSDGIKYHNYMEKEAIITQIIVANKISQWYYRKLRLRKSLDFSSLTMAASLGMDKEIRICINGMSMAPMYMQSALGVLSLDDLQKRAAQKCKTVDNDLMPLKYRRKMMNVFLEEMYNSFIT